MGILVDDTLAAGCEQFSSEEEEKSKTFDVKPRDGKLPFKFGGLMLSEIQDAIRADQMN